MHPQRRTGRIAKELPILLLGADASGKVVAEETKTVVLSRHGAGVVSRYKFAPDEVLTLRLAGSTREAEVRLVGQIGGEPGRYVYGLTFVDPDINFWPMDFPPPEPFAAHSRRVTLECSFCQARQTVEPDDIEEDVYSVNGNVLRYCERCGSSTPWIKARGETIAPEPPCPPMPDSPLGNFAPAPPLVRSDSDLQVPSSAVSASAPGNASEPALPAESPSPAYSAAAIDTLPGAATDFSLEIAPPDQEPAACDVAPVPPEPDIHGRRVNRRKHVRVRVAFHACVRQGDSGDDLVECQNVSKGGLCFQSRKDYALDSAVEVAAPYSPGEPALFVPAKITRCERLGDGGLFRYGVAYISRGSTDSPQ